MIRKRAGKQRFFDHLAELRYRIIFCLIVLIAAWFAVFLVLPAFFPIFFFYVRSHPPVFSFFHVTEAFALKMKLAFFGGTALSLPFLAYHAAAFVFPALHEREIRMVKLGAAAAGLFFLLGMAFFLFVVLPPLLPQLLGQSERLFAPALSASSYVGLILSFALYGGAVFLLPPLMIALARLGVLTYPILARARKPVWLGLLTLVMLIAPGSDWLLFALIALPLGLFYEGLILVLRYLAKNRGRAAHAG